MEESHLAVGGWVYIETPAKKMALNVIDKLTKIKSLVFVRFFPHSYSTVLRTVLHIVRPNEFHSTAPLLAVDYGTYNYVNFDTYLHFDAVTVSHPKNRESAPQMNFPVLSFQLQASVALVY